VLMNNFAVAIMNTRTYRFQIEIHAGKIIVLKMIGKGFYRK